MCRPTPCPFVFIHFSIEWLIGIISSSLINRMARFVRLGVQLNGELQPGPFGFGALRPVRLAEPMTLAKRYTQ